MRKKLLSILALLLTVSGAWADDITVYFTDALDWGSVYVYYWGSNSSTGWPGNEMEPVETNDYGQSVYKASIPSDASGIIFTNGKDGNYLNQTVDINQGIEDGAWWYPNGEKDVSNHYIVVLNQIIENKFEYNTVYAVGNGNGNWLNGANWDPAYVENEMTEIEDGVWEITFYDVPKGSERQVKFAIDGAWDHNFGWPTQGELEFEPGVWYDAVYDGDNITFDTEDEWNITITLDLSQFNFTTKEGAKFRIDNVEEIEGTDISAATVTGINASYDWTGSVIHPEPVVTLDGNVLSSATDYDVSYSDGCTTEGSYSVTITGKGDYNGTIVVPFKINGEYYLVGTMTYWQIEQAYKLVKNEEAEGEYYISDVELAEGDEIKVKSAAEKWYPDGYDNYIINHDGIYNVYFRPNGDGGEDWFGNTIYVADVTPTPEDTYIVAGNNTAIFGTTWDASNEDNLMTKGDDGKYRKEYTVAQAYDNVQLKVVKNGEDWFGVNGNNVEFKLTGAGTFTVVFDPEAEVASVTGDIAEEITGFGDYTVYAVGNGEDNWLNGAAWDPSYPGNAMTKIADDVWEIKFENVPVGFERQVKFVLGGDWDDPWTHNFGWPTQGELKFEPGVWYDAVYNGGNITFDTDDYCTVTLTLDLSQFDFTTQTGAMFKIGIAYRETEEVDVALAPTGYGTYYNSEKTVTLPAGVVAYTVSGVSGDQPTYVKIADGDDETNNTVLAATAVLLYCESKPETVTLTLTPSDDTYSGDNLLKGSDSQTTTTDGEKYYKLTYSNNNDNFGWYWGNDNGAAFVSPAHKAWLALPAAAGARAFIGLPGGKETGIITVQSQLVNDGAWYDLNGRRLSMKPIIKGVYVNNGNKVVIR